MQTLNLNQLAQETEGLSSQRENSLESLYLKGRSAFERALASGFEDKNALKESGNSFFRILQQAPEDYRPHLFLGYFLMLMGDHAQSELFLKQAQALKPDNQEIPQLLKALAEQKDLPQFQSLDLSLPFEQQNPNLEILYSECVQLIQSRFKTLSASPILAASDKLELTRLKNRLNTLERFWERVQPVLDFLLPHFGSEQLDALAAPLRNQQSQLLCAYQMSEQLIQLKQELGLATQTISEELKKVRTLRTPQDFQGFANKLEVIYDQCDHFADLVDGLGNQNPAATALEKGYERLLKFVNQLQTEWESQKRRFPHLQSAV